jgi:hypothetical protein
VLVVDWGSRGPGFKSRQPDKSPGEKPSLRVRHRGSAPSSAYALVFRVKRSCRRAEAHMPRRARGEGSVRKIIDKKGRVVWEASITVPPMCDGIPLCAIRGWDYVDWKTRSWRRVVHLDIPRLAPADELDERP